MQVFLFTAMRLIRILYIALLAGSTGFAQDDPEVQLSETLNGTLEQQFDYVYKKSNNYETYRVVSKKHFEYLKKSSIDSVKVYKNEIDILTSKLVSETNERDSLTKELTDIKEDFYKVKQEKDEVSFFGINLDNGLFNIVVLAIVVFLGLLLALFIMKFNNAKSESKVAVENLSKVEDEYVDYKRRAMEKEQQLGRKLQDEINKNKKKKE